MPAGVNLSAKLFRLQRHSTGSQEPVLGISLIPRTGCWHQSSVFNFPPWKTFYLQYNLFSQTCHRPVANFW